MKVNDKLHGFTVTSVRRLDEINATLVEMVYDKNGAKLIWLDRPDTNMTFSIGFKTVPEDSTGVFHILEHSVLCGSEKFPVKEPFVNLLKTSLSTFLNAMTFPDKTMYPVSSRNNKDFLNLMDVYMDAVLHPAIYKNPEIFSQEGWHYEFAEDGSLIRNGVVYSEMKGAFASVDELLYTEMMRLLLPDTCYSFVSGGHPDNIPDLTYEQFIENHHRFYHPSNSYIFLDGMIPTDDVFALLDSYLKDYERSDKVITIADQKPIEYCEYRGFYEVDPDAETKDRSQLAIGTGVGTADDAETALALDILGDVLCGTNEAPLKKAILEKGLAESVSFQSGDGIKYLGTFIIAKNTDESKLDELIKTINDTLLGLAENGIDRDMLNASINNIEFSMRERDWGGMPKGLAFNILALQSWLYDADPTLYILCDERFKNIRKKVEEGYFEQLIRTALLDNPHKAMVFLAPSKTLGEEKKAKLEAELADILSGWDDAKKEEVRKDAEHLRIVQQTPDTPEQLATLPILAISDISDTPDKLTLDVKNINGKTVLSSPTDTSGILYTNFYFDASDLTAEELSAVSFMASLIGHMETTEHSAIELQNILKSNLGNFHFRTDAYGDYTDSENATPYIVFSLSVLESKKDMATKLAKELLTESLFKNSQLIGQILRQNKLGMYEGIMGSGHAFAMSRVFSCYSAKGVIAEQTSGIEKYNWLRATEADFDSAPEALLDKMTALYKRIFTADRLTLGITGEFDENWAHELLEIVPRGSAVTEKVCYAPKDIRREAFVIPAEISFSSMGANLYALGEKYDGSMSVASTLLSFDYLWNVVRVQNGAYGVGVSVQNGGNLRYYSYRDPNAANSIDTFKNTGAYLRENPIPQEALDTLIIGTIGTYDPLRTPRTNGEYAFTAYLNGIDDDTLVNQRRQMLAATPEKLLEFSKLLDDIAEKGALCVIGGKALVDACGDRIDTVSTIIQ